MNSNIIILPQTKQLISMHTIVRNKEAERKNFIFYSKRIIRLLLEEALCHVPYEKENITTPIGKTYEGLKIAADLCAVPIIRSGESMEDELRLICPDISIGKVLMQRNPETKQPDYFYSNLPHDISEKFILLLDPMLATGGTAAETIKLLIKKGVKEQNIIFICFIASPEGLEKMTSLFPNIKIITSSKEEGLNENAYMLPGIGDFGDRFYGTEKINNGNFN